VCGFIGVVGVPTVAPVLCLGLSAVQHRGQDAAGIGVVDRGHCRLHKDVGKVSRVFSPEVLEGLSGTTGVGHVRYPTAGVKNSRVDAQPFMTRRPPLVLAHNGQVTNMGELRRHLLARGLRVTSTSDSEALLLIFGDELLAERVVGFREDDVVAALGRTLDRVRGSFSAVAMIDMEGEETLIAFRDPHGFRPAVYGQRPDGAWVAASESVSLDVVDAEVRGHVPPGAVVFLRAHQEPVVRQVRPAQPSHCIFEDIYFARPDSILETGRVYTLRQKMGAALARRWQAKGHEADVVVAVPDTSRPAAQAMAEHLGLPSREGFIKNRYSGRTFIMPDQASREAAMRLKLNPIDEIFRGQRVVIVDDSIVRGTTMRRIVQLVRRFEPAALHVAIFSPPVRHPCFYGIDMPTRGELVAADIAGALHDVEAGLAERFGADSVTFLPVRDLEQVAGDRLCAACFTGSYPVPVPEDEQGFIVKDRQRESHP